MLKLAELDGTPVGFPVELVLPIHGMEGRVMQAISQQVPGRDLTFKTVSGVYWSSK